MTPTLVYVDGMSLIRTIAEAIIHANPKNVQEGITLSVPKTFKKLQRTIQAKYPDQTLHYCVVLEGDSEQYPSWRVGAYPFYKLDRKPTPEVLVQAMPDIEADFINQGVTLIQKQGVEADDVIFHLATNQNKAIVVSKDKDLFYLASKGVAVYNYFTDTWITEDYIQTKFGVPASKFPWYQALVGDSVDNIPGVNGIGTKTAAKLISLVQDWQDLWKPGFQQILKPREAQLLNDGKEAAELSLKLCTLGYPT